MVIIMEGNYRIKPQKMRPYDLFPTEVLPAVLTTNNLEAQLEEAFQAALIDIEDQKIAEEAKEIFEKGLPTFMKKST